MLQAQGAYARGGMYEIEVIIEPKSSRLSALEVETTSAVAQSVHNPMPWILIGQLI